MNWIFSEEVVQLHKKHWVWELLANTIEKSITTMELLQKKLAETENPSETTNASQEVCTILTSNYCYNDNNIVLGYKQLQQSN